MPPPCRRSCPPCCALARSLAKTAQDGPLGRDGEQELNTVFPLTTNYRPPGISSKARDSRTHCLPQKIALRGVPWPSIRMPVRARTEPTRPARCALPVARLARAIDEKLHRFRAGNVRRTRYRTGSSACDATTGARWRKQRGGRTGNAPTAALVPPGWGTRGGRFAGDAQGRRHGPRVSASESVAGARRRVKTCPCDCRAEPLGCTPHR